MLSASKGRQTQGYLDELPEAQNNISTEGNAAMSGVIMQDDMPVVERRSSTMGGGEHIEDAQRRCYDASTERQEASPLDGSEAKQLKIDDDIKVGENARLTKGGGRYTGERGKKKRSRRGLRSLGCMKQSGFWPNHRISVIEGNYFVTSEISNGSSKIIRFISK